VLEEGAEGVRLMTVHTAKGLEFPVVILADMTANLAALEPDRHVDATRGLCATRLLRCAPYELLEREAEEKTREMAEGVRVAYVAATRARDLLIVPVCGDEERDGWISPLNKAVYPPRDRYRESRRAPACCPTFGDASVLKRPDDYIGHPEFSVKPGLHRAQAGGHDVVWWDPATLKLEVGANFGLRQEDILAGAGPDDGLAKYREWQQAREQAIEQGERMEFDILTPSQAASLPPAACPVTTEELPVPPARPAGPRFGTLLHLVLRDLDLARAAAEADALAGMHGRVLGATAEEIPAAAEAARTAIAHPLITRARNATRLHRELPIMLRLNGNQILEGIIDLAFQEQDTWTVVDFKSTSDLKSHRAEYERQLQWYGAALAKITGEPVRGCVLGV
jgi:ATP-dependent exoDNAse (exonuclease V) beta subunit